MRLDFTNASVIGGTFYNRIEAKVKKKKVGLRKGAFLLQCL